MFSVAWCPHIQGKGLIRYIRKHLVVSVAACPNIKGKCGTLGNTWCILSLGVRKFRVNTIH